LGSGLIPKIMRAEGSSDRWSGLMPRPWGQDEALMEALSSDHSHEGRRKL
jgi:hypothetical protein